MTNIPVVYYSFSDDAPNSANLTFQHAHCWIHDGRNYKKAATNSALSSGKTESFFWIDIGINYGKLCEFKIKPDAEIAEKLDAELNICFLQNRI